MLFVTLKYSLRDLSIAATCSASTPPRITGVDPVIGSTMNSNYNRILNTVDYNVVSSNV